MTNPQLNLTFEDIYMKYYPKLVRFCKEYVLASEDAENIVQDCFVYLWEQKDKISSIHNLNAFLFWLVKNRCIDFLRQKIMADDKKENMQNTFIQEYTFKLQSIELFDNSLSDNEIEQIIEKAINSLPDKCRDIFILNKIEGLKYDEIAQQMNLSPNTVRNQIAIALKKMKSELKDYIPLLFFLIS
ncbi:RNA polymerase sigma-70 factor [Bacteroides sp. 519]|uniref:RNA polymerase sigma-70 factor n=1 Tax=Bacteroides sp. 519 TaxID=2302937 RepID=UPI0013D33776|nr:RNA polymerase sigma-70 factor [Bacteroides sp. 519]NDV60114.1 RNA polymerase sigma-70 factor [Bacteroides sp. 519]